MARRRNKGEERLVAVRRIDHLLERARAEGLAQRGDLADRYVAISLAVAQKYQTGLERRHKAQICRACLVYLIPGRTSRTRLARGRIATTCLRCGHIARRPLPPASPAARLQEGGRTPPPA